MLGWPKAISPATDGADPPPSGEGITFLEELIVISSDEDNP